MNGKWSEEKAWKWYNSQPWIRGYSTYPSNCVNRIAMWQEYKHDEVIKQADYEFSLAKETGFNAVRAIIQFDVWLYQHDSFMKNLEEYISVANKHSQKVMLVLGNDCTVAKSRWKAPVFGEQKIDWGYHSGIKGGQHAGDYKEPGYQLLDESDLLEKFYEMVGEIAQKYAKDERVQIWNIWNEVGNSNRENMSRSIMEKTFEIVRSYSPIQPLTADVWSRHLIDEAKDVEKLALELSDIISFHCYGPYNEFVIMIKQLKEKYNRPLVCSEWLNRLGNNNVNEIFPLLYLEKIGSYHWGLMQGFSQTFEPWGGYFIRQANGENLDLTVWQHDIFRFNGMPYIPSEIKTFKLFSSLADEDWRRKNE